MGSSGKLRDSNAALHSTICFNNTHTTSELASLTIFYDSDVSFPSQNDTRLISLALGGPIHPWRAIGIADAPDDWFSIFDIHWDQHCLRIV